MSQHAATNHGVEGGEAPTDVSPLAPSPAALTPRARVALLTLQLRRETQQVETLEAEIAASRDPDEALDELRSKLGPMLDDQRRACAVELEDTRREAAESVAGAQAQATQTVKDATIRADHADRAAEQLRAGEQLRADEQMRADEQFGADAELPPPIVFATPTTVIALADILPGEDDEPLDDDADVRLSDTEDTDAPADARPIVVTIDAEVFARVFAAAIAPLLEQHNQPTNPQSSYDAVPQYYRQPPSPKKSFWAHTWHPDVLLSILATIIVLVVLVAWSG